MKAFLALLRLSFRSLLTTTMGRGSRKRKKSVSGIGAFVLLGFIMIFLSVNLSFSFGMQFKEMDGGMDILFMYIGILALYMPFVMTVFTAQGMIFSTKDVDLLLSLPISSFSVLLARVSALYLEVLYMCQLMLLPMGVAWLIYGGGGGAGFILLLFLCGFFLAIIPTFMGLVFGFIVSIITSRMKNKNLFITLLNLAFVVVVLFFYFRLSGSITLILSPGAVKASLGGYVPPVLWALEAVQGNIIKLLLLAAVTVLPFLLITWLLSISYKWLLTGILSHSSGSKYKHKELSASGSFQTLLKREAARFFTTPAYLLNQGIGILMTLALCVAAVIFKSKIAMFMPIISIKNSTLYIALLCILILMVSLIMPASVSISLEGKSLWILKEAPLGTGKIFSAKIIFNLILQGGTMVISLLCLYIAFEIELISLLLMIIASVFISGTMSMMFLVANLWFPKMDWENETIVIKQSASVIVSMVLSMLIAGITVGIYALVNSISHNFYASMLAIIAVNALIMFVIKQYLNSGGRRVFDNL